MPGIQLGGYVEGLGKELFPSGKGERDGGIVAKRKDSIYQPERQTSDWLEDQKRGLQQEFMVGGFSEGKGSRKNLGALLLGAYRKTNGN
jgi:bifunctional non-homologous end joining protein LigD